MKWKVKVETSPDVFAYVTTAIAGTTVVNGVAVYNDGFADDGSGWGDDESNSVNAQQALWQSQDPENRCYSCEWAGA